MTSCPKCQGILYGASFRRPDTLRLCCPDCDWHTPTLGELTDMWWGLQQAGRVDREPESRVHVSGMPQVVYGPREGE